jgi:hypothetical protein
VGVSRGLDAVEQGPRDFGVDARPPSIAWRIRSSAVRRPLLGVQGFKDDVALEAWVQVRRDIAK